MFQRLRRPKQPRTSGGMTLRWKLLVAAVALALIPLIALGTLLNVRSTSALEDEALQGMEGQAQTIQLALNDMVNSHAADTALLARSSFLFFQSASTQARRDYLRDHAELWGYPEDILVVGNDGDVQVGLGDTRNYGNQQDRGYYREAAELEQGRVFIGDIGFDEVMGEEIINIATPAFNDLGVWVGVLRIAWSVDDLLAQTATLGRGENLEISIIDNTGLVVASSDEAQIGQNRAGFESVGAALQGQDGTTREATEAGGTGDDFIAFAPIAESDAIAGLGWAVTVSSPADVVLEPAFANRNWTIAVSVIVAVLAILIALIFSRYLVGPIQRLAEAAREVAGGNYRARAPVESRDEVGTTAQAFNQMLDEVTGLIQTREDRDRIQVQIMQLLTEVNAAAEGDLTVEAQVTSDELGSVADSFNFMIGELRQIISNVNETTTEVRTASVEIAASSSNLALSSEQQSTRIAEAATAVENMALSIQDVSENAALSSTVAGEARENAQRGGTAVNATIEGMNRIRDQVEQAQRIVTRLGESSVEIGSFVQLISQIARQTNTLALNASIQAARAGEHGRGFAVVADEVRRLAERSSTAAKQVSSLVSSIQTETSEAVEAMRASAEEVNDGSQLADDAGAALTEIDAVVGRLAELIESISQAAEEQARTSVEVSQAMREINEVTQTTTTGTRNAAESVASLSTLAERLRESVATFRIGDVGGAPQPVEGGADGD